MKRRLYLILIGILTLCACKTSADDSNLVGVQPPPSPTIDSIPPNIPSIVLTSTESAKITLYWSKNTEADFHKYLIYFGKKSSETFFFDSISDINTTQIDIIDLENNVVHYFNMSAVDSSGNESERSELLFDVPRNNLPSSTLVPLDTGNFWTQQNNVTRTIINQKDTLGSTFYTYFVNITNGYRIAYRYENGFFEELELNPNFEITVFREQFKFPAQVNDSWQTVGQPFLYTYEGRVILTLDEKDSQVHKYRIDLPLGRKSYVYFDIHIGEIYREFRDANDNLESFFRLIDYHVN